MKAKDLIILLSKNPDANIVIEQYNGGADPLHDIRGGVFESKGQKTSARDHGAFIDKNGIVKEDIIILHT